jgi:hypothetical protein
MSDNFVSFRLHNNPKVCSINQRLSLENHFSSMVSSIAKKYMNVKKMNNACSLVQFVHCKKKPKGFALCPRNLTIPVLKCIFRTVEKKDHRQHCL